MTEVMLKGDVTALERKLKDRIRQEAPLSVEAFMAACLYDQDHGYYAASRVIGAGGDFTTAPEMSQAFGELIGLWAVVAWRAMGAPAAVNLVELGPGRGTMMADLLRAARIVPGFLETVHLHLVECSALLREAQEQTLRASGASVGGGIAWHRAFDDALLDDPAIAGRPSIIVANEFLDTAPIRQVIYAQGAWRERCVGLDRNGRLHFVLGHAVEPPADSLPRRPLEGDILEIRPALSGIARLLGRWPPPLAALFIDYGYESPAFGDTLQAVRQQRYVSPLEAPGTADLTAHVDFAAFARLCRAAGLAVDGPISQSQFLLGMGLAERMRRLMQSAGREQLGALEAGAVRIADPAGMGGLFKVIAIRSSDLAPLPPFPPAGASGGGRAHGG
jgi:NADH dehydrogenase [ubiquinone] 1 alpha subcomplex assembly factor 7